MTMYRRFSPTIQSAFSVVILIVLWLAFAPTQVGGLASYIIVIGNSMEPNFHIGDLVIVHKQPVYQVGEAVVYRNLQLENFVFHRIISQQLGHYALKGDNNSWVDTYTPSYREVVGKLWLHIPRGGIVIRKIRSPFVMAFIAGTLGVALATHLFGNRAKGNKRMNNKSIREWFTAVKQKTQAWFTEMNHSTSQGASKFNQGELWEASFFILGAIMLSSLILGIIAFSQPASRVVQDDISYQHLGIFSYSAAAPQGVYDTNTIKSGDPIFTKLTCSVDVNFQYTLIATQAKNITGTYQLTAVISEPASGWQRVVPLQEEAQFTGTAFGTNAQIDLCKISSLAQSMEQKTDFHPGTYTLVITPNIKLNGTISSRTFEGIFNSGLTFRYDHVQFYLVRSEEQGNPLVLTEREVLREERKEANTMLLLGREISIPTLRWAALFGFIASLSGFVLLGLKLQNLSRLDQEKFFRIRYDSMMVDIENTGLSPSATVTAVKSMEALAKLAERFNAIILHTSEGNLHSYSVQVDGITYRFALNADKAEATLLKEEAISQEGEP